MVLNCVLHRYNIDHVDQHHRHGARDGRRISGARQHAVLRLGACTTARSCCRRASSCERAEAVVERYRRARSATRCKIFFVVPDYFETPPEALHERLGLGVPRRRARRRRAALPHRAHAAGPRRSRTCATAAARDLVRQRRLQPLSRHRLDEGAVPQLRREERSISAAAAARRIC